MSDRDNSSNQRLANELARELFKLGSEGMKHPCQRIQFMGGSYKDNSEYGMGGFIEPALARWLHEQLDKLSPQVETPAPRGELRAVCEEIRNKAQSSVGNFGLGNYVAIHRELLGSMCAILDRTAGETGDEPFRSRISLERVKDFQRRYGHGPVRTVPGEGNFARCCCCGARVKQFRELVGYNICNTCDDATSPLKATCDVPHVMPTIDKQAQ